MAVPKKKTSKSKRNMRRSHLALHQPHLSICSNCGNSYLSHHICQYCGFYNQKKIDIKIKAVLKSK